MAPSYSPTRIYDVLRRANDMLAQGQTLEDVCNKLMISRGTFSRWRCLFGGMDREQIDHWIELHTECSRLRRELHHQRLNTNILRAAIELQPIPVSHRRQFVVYLQSHLGHSERRICAALQHSRSTQRYRCKRFNDEQQLLHRIREIATSYPRFGYRRITVILKREGWRINRKRVRRLCAADDICVRKRTKKRSASAYSPQEPLKRADSANEIWAWDFTTDEDVNGRELVWFSVLDEFTRECIVLEVGRSFNAYDVQKELASVILQRPTPSFLRSDNDLLWKSTQLEQWLDQKRILKIHINRGAPWENCFVESFQSRLRDELIDGNDFENLSHARLKTASWKAEYNSFRPHSGLGYLTPHEFAQRMSSKRRSDD